MNEKIEAIYYAFGKKLIGSMSMKIHVCEVVSLLPEEMISFVTKNCWFMASMEDAWAFTFTSNDLKGQHLIFLSDELLFQDEGQIHYSIAHEIGHVVLNHRNSVISKQSAAEIEQQEKEADEFARIHLESENQAN